MNTTLEIVTPPGDPLLFRVIKTEGKKKKQIASALVLVYETKKGRMAEVLQVFVDKVHRRMGIGKLLVKSIQKSFDKVVTGWEDSTPPGKELFLSAGFGMVKSLKNGVNSTLEWEKGESKKVIQKI